MIQAVRFRELRDASNALRQGATESGVALDREQSATEGTRPSFVAPSSPVVPDCPILWTTIPRPWTQERERAHLEVLSSRTVARTPHLDGECTRVGRAEGDYTALTGGSAGSELPTWAIRS